MKIQAKAINQDTITVVTNRMAPVIAALMVGSFLMLSAGFANSTTVHNATHDARHAFAFPCH